jgi:hypothetical protein
MIEEKKIQFRKRKKRVIKRVKIKQRERRKEIKEKNASYLPVSGASNECQ